jgi:hypothetical protein
VFAVDLILQSGILCRVHPIERRADHTDCATAIGNGRRHRFGVDSLGETRDDYYAVVHKIASKSAGARCTLRADLPGSYDRHARSLEQRYIARCKNAQVCLPAFASEIRQ